MPNSPSGSSFVASLWSCAAASLFGGVTLLAVEATDRIVVLWPSFNSAVEPIVFAAYLAPIVLLVAGVGIVVGLALHGLGWTIRATARRVERVLGRASLLGAAIAFATLATIAGAVALKTIQHAYRLRSLGRIASLLSLYFMDADRPFLSHVFYALGDKVFPILVLLCFAASMAIALVATMLVSPTARSTWLHVLPAMAAAVGVVLVYALDSRFEYARYDKFIHLPASLAQCVLAFLAASLALEAFRTRIAVAAVRRGALVVLALALATCGFDLVHVGRNENLKALLWRRSVVARRAYAIAAGLDDRDGDGFSPLFAGADLDDRNASVNPLETEIPGNGIDDNCIGGDLLAAPTAPTQAMPATTNGKRFVLIGIDTLRADRMSLYGYGRPTTPRIDELARSGLVFDACTSAGTNTAVAFSAMQTSASRGGVFESDRERLWPRLGASGYATAQVNAVERDIWLRAKSASTPYRDVLLDGIETFPHELGDDFWDADKVTDAAIQYFASASNGGPTATWVHYFDPHTPRRKMAPFDFGDSPSDFYDTEVAFADREVGRLLDWMRDSGMMKDTIVILMADHGEAFMEHGMDFHGNRPYNEQVQVPLVVWAPGLAPGRSDAPVSTVDIAPTVYDFTGLGNMPRAEGRSLLQPIPQDRPIFSETPLNIVDGPFHAFAVTQSGYRLIWDIIGNTTELYDLRADPHELHNLADADPQRVASLRAQLAHWLDTTRSVANANDARHVAGED